MDPGSRTLRGPKTAREQGVLKRKIAVLSMTRALFFRCRRGQRLGLVYHINRKDFQGLVAGNLGIMDGSDRDLIGVAGFQVLDRLAVENEIGLALHDGAAFDARVAVAPGAAAGGNFSNAAHADKAGREFGLLQGRALDGGLLRESGARAGEG